MSQEVKKVWIKAVMGRGIKLWWYSFSRAELERCQFDWSRDFKRAICADGMELVMGLVWSNNDIHELHVKVFHG